LFFPHNVGDLEKHLSVLFLSPDVNGAHKEAKKDNDTLDFIQDRGASKSARASLLPKAI
jgi:hypothetical protein